MCEENTLDTITLQALRFTSERNHAAHERRVSHELQVVIASLTFFTLSAAATLSNSFSLDDAKLFMPCVLFAFLALCLIASKYIKSSAQSNKLNLDEARAAEQDILEYLKPKQCEYLKKHLDNKKSDIPPPSENRWRWEIAIIWGGAILAGAIIFEKWVLKLAECLLA